jgi:hypothetical protein
LKSKIRFVHPFFAHAVNFSEIISSFIYAYFHYFRPIRASRHVRFLVSHFFIPCKQKQEPGQKQRTKADDEKIDAEGAKVTRRPQRKGCFCMGHIMAHGNTMFFSAPLCAAFAHLCVIPLPLLFLFFTFLRHMALLIYLLPHPRHKSRISPGARGRRGYGRYAGDSGARFFCGIQTRPKCASRGAR